MSDDVKVYGLQELGGALDLLPRNVERTYIRVAAKAGAEVIRSDAEARAPKISGDLAKKIIVKTKVTAGAFLAFIGVRYMRILAATSRRPGKVPSTEDPGVYALFVEKGRPNREGHTHQTAHPFLAPAFKAKVDEAEQKVADELRRQLGDLIQ